MDFTIKKKLLANNHTIQNYLWHPIINKQSRVTVTSTSPLMNTNPNHKLVPKERKKEEWQRKEAVSWAHPSLFLRPRNLFLRLQGLHRPPSPVLLCPRSSPARRSIGRFRRGFGGVRCLTAGFGGEGWVRRGRGRSRSRRSSTGWSWTPSTPRRRGRCWSTRSTRFTTTTPAVSVSKSSTGFFLLLIIIINSWKKKSLWFGD